MKKQFLFKVRRRRGSLLLFFSVFQLACVGKSDNVRNVILVTVDTLRSDYVGFINPQRPTPNLDRIAEKSLVYPNCYATSPMTLPSHASILTGLYPYQHGVRDNFGFRLEDKKTVASILQAKGFKTAAFISAFPLDKRFGLNKGFSVYDDNFPLVKTGIVVAERSGAKTVKNALDWWNNNVSDSPIFLWIHLFEPHAPYKPPKGFVNKDNYYGEVLAADFYLKPVIDIVLSRDDTAFIFTSDHGEGLGEKGELTHGLFAYQYAIKVPLLIYSPSLKPLVIESNVSHVDILPSVLYLVGVETDYNYSGVNIVNTFDSKRVLYFEALNAFFSRGWAPLRGVVEDKWKYIELPKPELYNVAEDPKENHNVVNRYKKIVKALREHLPKEDDLKTGSFSFRGDVRSTLESLGYLTRSVKSPSLVDPKDMIPFVQKLHDAINLYSHRKYEKALEVTLDILRRVPTFFEACKYANLAARTLGKTGESVEVLQNCIKAGVNHPEIYRMLALTYAEIGQFKRALEVLQLSTDDSLEYSKVKAKILLELDYKKVLRQIDDLIFLEPYDPELYLIKALAIAKKGDVQLAAEELVKAKDKIGTLTPEGWNTLGALYVQMGNLEKSIEFFKKALEMNPYFADAYYNLAVVYRKKGDTQKAYEYLKKYSNFKGRL